MYVVASDDSWLSRCRLEYILLATNVSLSSIQASVASLTGCDRCSDEA